MKKYVIIIGLAAAFLLFGSCGTIGVSKKTGGTIKVENESNSFPCVITVKNFLTSAWVSSIKIAANETKSISVSESGSYIIKAVYMAPELGATDGVTYPSLAAFTGVIVTTGETVQVKIRTPTGL
jgi:hypothetical protein